MQQYYHSPTKQYFTPGTPFTLDGIQYPANWLLLATTNELAAIHLTPVTPTNAPEDDRFYWVSSTLDGANLTYTNTPKDLPPLIESQVANIKAITHSMLQPTDYVDVRNLRDPSYKTDVIEWRQRTLTYSRTLTASILAVTSVAELQQVLNDVSWPTLTTPTITPPSATTMD